MIAREFMAGFSCTIGLFRIGLMAICTQGLLAGQAGAACGPAATVGADSVTCTNVGPLLSYDGLTGSDTIEVRSGSYVGLTINGGDDDDTLTVFNPDLLGTFVQFLYGGAGNDTILINNASADVVSAADGNDDVVLESATVGSVLGGDGNDNISAADTGGGPMVVGLMDGGGDNDSLTLYSGTATSILGGDGNDQIRLAGGTLTTIASGEAGSDALLVTNAFSFADFTGILDGGDNVSIADGFIDRLTIEVAGTVSGAALTNWEAIDFNLGSQALTLTGSGLLTSSETGYGARLLSGSLNLSGSFYIGGNFFNQGLVDIGANSVAGDILTVAGDYVGNGGTLQFDLALSTSAPATDAMIVHGTVGGSTLVLITDTTPLDAGILTGTGPGQGIPLVASLSGAILPGQFTLIGGSYVKGAIIYFLNADSDGVLYLQSLAAGQVFGYAGLPEFLRDDMPALHDRIAARLYSGTEVSTDAQAPRAWVRLIGARRQVLSEQDPLFAGSGWTQSRRELTFGIDGPVDVSTGDATVTIGGHVIDSTGITFSPFAAMSSRVNGRGVGVSFGLTWYGASGLYLDNQYRVTLWDSGVRAGPVVQKIAATTWAASLELGRDFKLTSGTVLTPRAQLVLSDVGFDAVTDSVGIDVALGAGQSHELKFGLTAEHRVKPGLTLFADAELSRDFAKDTTVIVDSLEVPSFVAPVWGRMTLGAAMALGKNGSAQISVDLARPIGQQGSNERAIQAGLQLRF